MGNKPKPDAIKELEGNPGKSPMTGHAKAAPLTDVPEPPEWLGEYGVKEWERVAPTLVNMRILADADVLMLAVYCQNVHIMVEAAIDLANQGNVVMGTRGWVRNPSLTAFNAAVVAMRALAAEFGMTPSSRARVSIPTGDVAVTLDELLGELLDDDIS